jgi:hypothetical protein
MPEQFRAVVFGNAGQDIVLHGSSHRAIEIRSMRLELQLTGHSAFRARPLVFTRHWRIPRASVTVR